MSLSLNRTSLESVNNSSDSGRFSDCEFPDSDLKRGLILSHLLRVEDAAQDVQKNS
jgi:hypothetical protein